MTINLRWNQVAAVLLLVWAAAGKPGLNSLPIVSDKATACTYVYEKDDTAIPSPVLAALNTLNRQGIMANVFEQDTVDGEGQVPDQYKAPLAAAKTAGLPCLVVSAGEKVLRVVKSPKTEEAVLEAAR